MTQLSPLRWVILVKESFEDEPGLVIAGRTINCAPLSMIQRRLDDHESVDLAELARETVPVIEAELSSSGTG